MHDPGGQGLPAGPRTVARNACRSAPAPHNGAAMTLLYTHPSGHLHATPPGHPEQVARLDAVLTALDGLDLDRRAAPAADDADILRGHAPEYLAALERRTPDRGWSMLDADTALSPDSLMAARHAVGAELVYPIPGAGVFLKGAYYKEVNVKAGSGGAEPKGSMVRFTLVKAF